MRNPHILIPRPPHPHLHPRKQVPNRNHQFLHRDRAPHTSPRAPPKRHEEFPFQLAGTGPKPAVRVESPRVREDGRVEVHVAEGHADDGAGGDGVLGVEGGEGAVDARHAVAFFAEAQAFFDAGEEVGAVFVEEGGGEDGVLGSRGGVVGQGVGEGPEFGFQPGEGAGGGEEVVGC